jgi:hypothetical protein
MVFDERLHRSQRNTCKNSNCTAIIEADYIQAGPRMEHPPGSDALRTQIRETIEELLTAIRKTITKIEVAVVEAESISLGRAPRKLCRTRVK